jgi:hypothetical protein
MRLQRRTAREEVYEVIKCRMQVSRSLKGKGIAHSIREFMMPGIVSKLLSELGLCSFSMFELVGEAG